MKTPQASLVVTAAFAPLLALAEPSEGARGDVPGGPENRGGARRDLVRPMVEAWKAADTDRDGFISKEEFDALPRLQNLPEDKRANLFKRLDKDADGRLSREEIGHMAKPQGPNQGPPMQRLWELDTDKSGGISLEEFKAGRLHAKLPPEKQDALFQRLDTNKDGMITPMDRPEPPFRRDGNEPHKPWRPDGERPPGQPMDPRMIIRQLDKDGDGAISFEEFQAAPFAKNLTEDQQEDRFEAMDRNHDKKITREDFPSMPPREGDAPRGPRGEGGPGGPRGDGLPGGPRGDEGPPPGFPNGEGGPHGPRPPHGDGPPTGEGPPPESE